MTGREKGSATAPCGACGTDLPLVDAPDGGVTTDECPKCSKPKSKPETASQTSGRERGTDTKESS